MIRLGLTVIFLFLTLVSCKEKSPAATPELIVSVDAFNFAGEGGSNTFHIKSNNQWTAVSTNPWCTLNINGGITGTTKIDIKVDKNPAPTPRTTEITITSESLKRKIVITQTGTDVLSVSKDAYTVNYLGETLEIEVDGSAKTTFKTDAFWLSSVEEPIGNKHVYKIKIDKNKALFERKGTIKFSVANLEKTVSITQGGSPLNVPESMLGVSKNASSLAQDMIVGWNLGNSLEACKSDTEADETMWGNPKVTKEFITKVKQAGFNSVRIPTAWSGYIEDRNTNKIKDTWLARVEEVVKYCIENDMYAIINVHWDGGWLEEHPLYSKQVEVNKKQKAIWEQIAVYFRDFDEHLLFAGTNEVRANYNEPTKEHIEVQESYNQTFTDAVRSTGGKNAYRNLIVQSYNTNITFANKYMTLPKDIRTDRLMAEVHFYDPWDFAGDENSNKYLWGKDFSSSANISNWAQEAWINEAFGLMKKKFVDKGVPVILGEYGAILRSGLNSSVLENHKKARNYYLNYVTKTAKQNGLIPFYWDNGFTGNNGFGIFNRATGAVVHQDALDALVK